MTSRHTSSVATLRHNGVWYCQTCIDPVREFMARHPFSSGSEGFVVQDIDGCYVLRHHGHKMDTDVWGQIVLIEWKLCPDDNYVDGEFQPVGLKYAQSMTFRLLDYLLRSSGDKRYRGYLVVTCSHADPTDPDAQVYVERLNTGTVHGPMTAQVFAKRIDEPWPFW